MEKLLTKMPEACADMALLTPADVGKLLRVTTQHANRMIRRGDLCHLKVGRPGGRHCRMVPAGEVRRWIEERVALAMADFVPGK